MASVEGCIACHDDHAGLREFHIIPFACGGLVYDRYVICPNTQSRIYLVQK